MSMKLSRILILSIVFLSFSHFAFATEKLFSIYTPYTFATTAIPYNTDQKVLNSDSSGNQFGLGVNIDYKKDKSFFIEKMAVKDSTKDIYITGMRFFPSDTKPAALKPAALKPEAPENKAVLKEKETDLPFSKVNYIFGLSRISQNETASDVDKKNRRTGYNMVLGTDILALKSSYLHFVPIRVLFAFGQNGCSAYVSTEIGLVIPKF